jgi:hypothetical protein
MKKAASSQGEFDLNAKILQAFGMDSYFMQLKLSDGSGEIFFT